MPYVNEVSYYPALAKVLEDTIRANVNSQDLSVSALYLPRDGSNIRTFLANYIQRQTTVSESLRQFARSVPKLRTDIAIVIDNPVTDRHSIIVIEAKLLNSAGLNEMSQLIGYCLVAKADYGLLVNIDGGISNELAGIINTDLDLTKIQRKLSHEPYGATHRIGVMTYSSSTQNLSYTPTSALGSLPQIISEIENELA